MSIDNVDVDLSQAKTIEERGALLRLRDDFDKRLTRVKKDLATQREQFAEIEAKLDMDDLAPEKETELQSRYDYLANTINKLNEEEEYYRSALDRIIDQLQSKKHFNKEVFLQNLRVLLKETDIKIGQIEKESGIQTGYVSRLEKPGNTTDPSAEFIMTASQMLNVPIDLLVKVSIGELSASERKMLKFFQSMIDDTRRGELTWNKESDTFFEKERFHILDDDTGMTDHPLFRADYYYNELVGGMRTDFTYLTSFFPDEGIRVIGNSYNASLPGADASIYLMKCGNFEELSPDYLTEFYEVYFVEKSGTVNPVFCTAQGAETVAEIVKALYLEVEVAGKQAHLTPGAMAIIDSYYKSKKSSRSEEDIE